MHATQVILASSNIRRASAFAIVILLHLVLLYVLGKQGTGAKLQAGSIDPIETTIVELEMTPVESAPPASMAIEMPQSEIALQVPTLEFEPRDDSSPDPRSDRASTTAQVTFCVLEDGRVDESSVAIAQSAHWPKLDEAAIKIAKRWKLTPAIKDGQPSKVCGIVAPIQFEVPR